MSFFLKFHSQNPEYFLYKYEDLVSGNFSQLENYLGFKLRRKVQVDYKHRRVSRTKGSGSWRNWFTTEDIDFFKPFFSNFMEKFGYDSDDWGTFEKKNILAQHSFEYVIGLINQRRLKEKMELFQDNNQFSCRS